MLQAARDHAPQSRVRIGHELPEVGCDPVSAEHLRRGPRERWSARDHLEQHRAERVDVRAPARSAPTPHLGCHVVRGADRDRARLLRTLEHHAREAEIDELRDAVLGDHRITGLDVTVDDAAAMRGRQPASEIHGDAQDLRCRQREQLAQRATADELADDVRPIGELSDAIHADHVRMLDACGRARLHQEALPRIQIGLDAGDELDRHEASEHRVLREVDPPHLATPELADEHVVVELLGRVEVGHEVRAASCTRTTRRLRRATSAGLTRESASLPGRSSTSTRRDFRSRACTSRSAARRRSPAP